MHCGLRRAHARRGGGPCGVRQRRIRGAAGGGRRRGRGGASARAAARELVEQSVHRAGVPGRRHRGGGARRRCRGAPQLSHEPPRRGPARGARRARPPRPSPRRARGLQLDPGAPHHPSGPLGGARPRRAFDPRDRARCRRRLRLQGAAVAGRGRDRRARARARSSRALDRGSRRAFPRFDAYARPRVPRHRLCRQTRPRARHRCGALRGRWRLCDVAERAVPRNRHGGAQPARALRHPEFSGEDLHGRHQQISHRPLSRRGKAGGVFRHRAHHG